MNDLEGRIKQGRKAITLAKGRGMDTALWEKELVRLEALAQAEEVAQRTRELLDSQGWCLWKCHAFDDEVIVVAIDEFLKGIPQGRVIYTDAELRELFGTDKSVTSATLRLVHEAKKRGALIASTRWKD